MPGQAPHLLRRVLAAAFPAAEGVTLDDEACANWTASAFDSGSTGCRCNLGLACLVILARCQCLL